MVFSHHRPPLRVMLNSSSPFGSEYTPANLNTPIPHKQFLCKKKLFQQMKNNPVMLKVSVDVGFHEQDERLEASTVFSLSIVPLGLVDPLDRGSETFMLHAQ